MYPHRIRLRGPWECEPLGRGGEEPPPPHRIHMPCRWEETGLASLTGRVRFRRRFGYPGRIDDHERVWLTFDDIAGTAEVRLNDCPLEGGAKRSGTVEFEVTALLRQRNEVVVEMESIAESVGLWGEAALEVRCTAFLGDMARFAILKGERIDLHVTGRVVGTAERPLEVYVVLDRSVVGYRVVQPSIEGQPFEVVAPDLAADGRSRHAVVQVDLVNGATVWYTDRTEVVLPTISERGQ